MSRYSNLVPLTINEQVNILHSAIEFFSPRFQIGKSEEVQKTFGSSGQQIVHPFSVMDFLKWQQKKGNDLFPRHQKIAEFLALVAKKGGLQECGTKGSPPLDKCYYFMLELTNIEQKGILFLGKYLGLEFIAAAIQANLVCIKGEAQPGVENIGSGILITPNIVLTCRHVITDMNVYEDVEINNTKYKIKDKEYHPVVDVAAILLEEPVLSFHKDIALRNSTLLERIVIAGYPKISRKISSNSIMQSGEIAGRIDSYNENSKEIQLELFTAISRPGNSGGPLLSADGKLLGIVTQSLERQMEEVDNQQTCLPCFAAVPASEILRSFKELKIAESYSIPYEDYQ